MINLSETENDNKYQSIAQGIIKHNPYIIALIPILLKRGSPLGRQFALSMAALSKKPELVAALKEVEESRCKVLERFDTFRKSFQGAIALYCTSDRSETKFPVTKQAKQICIKKIDHP